MIFLGVDPGKSGCIAALDESGDCFGFVHLDSTEADISNWILVLPDGANLWAMLEHVHSMPRQGVSSSFKFGTSYGFCRGLLVANKIPFEIVSPQKWQRFMGCLSNGDKNRTKAKAQELFPHFRVTHQTADALLLAEYCRRVRS